MPSTNSGFVAKFAGSASSSILEFLGSEWTNPVFSELLFPSINPSLIKKQRLTAVLLWHFTPTPIIMDGVWISDSKVGTHETQISERV
jgi:hypothetical protein